MGWWVGVTSKESMLLPYHTLRMGQFLCLLCGGVALTSAVIICGYKRLNV